MSKISKDMQKRPKAVSKRSKNCQKKCLKDLKKRLKCLKHWPNLLYILTNTILIHKIECVTWLISHKNLINRLLLLYTIFDRNKGFKKTWQSTLAHGVSLKLILHIERLCLECAIVARWNFHRYWWLNLGIMIDCSSGKS